MPGLIAKSLSTNAKQTVLALALLFAGGGSLLASAATEKQKALNEWRVLTSSAAPPPRVFVKSDNIRFYFHTETNIVEFSANWSRLRVRTQGYEVNSALVRLNQRLAGMPERERGWREATVVAGAEWRQLTTNLVAALTPAAPLHGIYYQGFLADRLWFRDAQGAPRFVPIGEQPKEVVVERRLSLDETLEHLAAVVEAHLARTHPQESLFLLLAPHASRFTHPLLLDRKQRLCVWLLPAALYDTTERGVALTATAQSGRALLWEGHGLALVKNPVSSVARLGDFVAGTVVRFLRLPLPRPGKAIAPPSPAPACGMDLEAWEKWLDRYTGTRRQEARMRLLLDGEQYFPRLQQAIAQATNHIRMDIYIFDRDDVAVEIADQLKQRSSQVQVQVLPDRLGTIGGGLSPPATPLPEDFVPPSSIIPYLRKDSRVKVRPFLNPWFSADHAKVILVDGQRAWLGGMNLGREYRFEWHDLMVELEGPVVASLEDEFRRKWAHAGPLGDLAYLSAVLTTPQRGQTPPAQGSWSTVRLLPTKTAWKPFGNAVQGAVRRARSYLYIQNPYLFDKKVIGGLVRARSRGVDVRVILPRVNDLKAGGRSNLVTANYLLQNGVRVYFYPGMTHVKALLADGWACVGSGNLNHMSLRFCQEQNIATSDPGFVARLKHDLFQEDFARSYELTEPISVDWVDFLSDMVLEGF